ncbi:MAG TPA: S24 family peptidase [Anaerolineales bacterium]|jgi:SOS-response transcriptional repressor LexA|nr:S24 family peptidase [Anaerolineales bacterium]
MAKDEDSINTLKVWFKKTLLWLHVDGSTAVFQRPHQKLFNLMENAYNANQSNQVWRYVGELEELTQTADPAYRGEVMLRCAKISCDLENLKEALRFCNEAEIKFKTYPHLHAVVLWMIGCIHWVNNSHVKGIANWQETIQIFTNEQQNWSLVPEKVKWYTNVIPMLENYLEQAMDSDTLPAYKEGLHEVYNGDPTALKWVDCQIHDEVPAGGFGAVGFEQPELNLEISEVLIEGTPYKAYKIREIETDPPTDSVVIQQKRKYHTLRIKGDSMNRATPVPIEHGDYVFVLAQTTANNDEIVVVEIRDNDSRATVKRLQRIGNRLILIPETSDETIKNLPEFSRDYSERELSIVGVVEAVFKKKT